MEGKVGVLVPPNIPYNWWSHWLSFSQLHILNQRCDKTRWALDTWTKCPCALCSSCWFVRSGGFTGVLFELVFHLETLLHGIFVIMGWPQRSLQRWPLLHNDMSPVITVVGQESPTILGDRGDIFFSQIEANRMKLSHWVIFKAWVGSVRYWAWTKYPFESWGSYFSSFLGLINDQLIVLTIWACRCPGVSLLLDWFSVGGRHCM